MNCNEIRRKFLDYFNVKDHQEVRSASLVPQDDPTLLFINAGMCQFKRTFLGEEKRDYVRATTSQKCVRAGGKHNDLENVGYTARHHTFFEMLGNFSFGDYFKEGAIEMSWDLLLNGFGLPKDKLWVSVFREDDDAYNIWHDKMGVSEDRLIRLGEKDNFWSMGDTGPCGPCSEILIDRGEAHSCGKPDCMAGCDCDRYLEIWNLVFMQYNRDRSGKMEPLPRPSIDTGMGLERIASIVQDVTTNYDTDLFMPIINKVEQLSGVKPGAEKKSDVAMKVIADHIRSTAFLIGDGVLPSNEGRGYVLRRIMRRAIRYGRNIGLMQPFLHETAEAVFDTMKSAYPELSGSSSFITNVIKNEELRFTETLDNGLKLLNDTLSEIRAKGETTVPGDIIFKLYDTFGFPVDIVRDVVRDEEMNLDMDGFDSAMAHQRELSRSVTSFSTMNAAYKNLSNNGIKPEFVGYTHTKEDGKVLVIVSGDKEVEEVSSGSIELVTDVTPFYGESGGQMGDVGTITASGFEMKVTDTIKDPTGITIHKGEVVSGSVKKGDTVTLRVDETKRSQTACNHTATHILHKALRTVLGDHVKQSGSLVSPDRLRFDFTHFSLVEPEQLDQVESYVNEKIRKNVDVDINEMNIEEAMKSGATALFEEKYGDTVRVITLSDFSRELCGGTHTVKTGNIGLMKILGETGVAAGIRRIEAVTGAAAVAQTQATSKVVRDTARLIKEKPELITIRVEKIIADQRSLEKEVAQLKAKIAEISADSGDDDIRVINDVKVMAKEVVLDNPGALRDLADKFRDKIQSGVVALACVNGGKVLLTVVVTKDLGKKFHAGNIVKEMAAVVGGGGGGRPDMAQAGGTKPENLQQALDKFYEIIEAV
ncbi:MAG: alanine--tRNA ligase [Desulfobacterales bacterium]|nr:alanine--tRNA ligase [Desulfobacterales bacterium]